MKKVLILTVTAGNGHNACAMGMKRKLESIGEVEVKVVDLLKSFSTRLNVWVADRGYALAVSRMLPLYNAFYRHYMKADPNKRYSCPSQKTVVSALRGFMEEILSFRPDVIYCTHFYGAIALTDLKLCYALPCKTVVSNLDYVNSPFWEAGIGVDYFAIPNDDFTDEFIKEGYRPEQLLPLGLPVDERTLERVEKEEARRRIGLDEDTFTVTVMYGGGCWSGGFGIFKSLIKSLEGRRAQIIVINGRNEKNFRKVQKFRLPQGLRVCNVGFTHEVPLYLSASDMIINKYGGTSVTEMINKSVPMLVPRKMAAQEQYNLEYMSKKGVALSFGNRKELKTQVLRLMDDSALREKMAENMQCLKKNAIDDLARFILSFPQADYSAYDREKLDLSRITKDVKKALAAADKAARREAKRNIGR